MKPVRFGMVGGGSGAFIGAVHRMAMRLDGRAELVAGALSSTPEKSIASGEELGLAHVYPDWRTMLDRGRDQFEAVAIVTPNRTHAEIAEAALRAGFHVVLDKPMVTSSAEAERLAAAENESGKTLTVTYNYSGYPLVRAARHLVRTGAIGAVRRVQAEYLQGWLSAPLESSGQKQAGWRTDPAQSGGAGALGDIGTHAEHLARFVTGLEPAHLCADVRTHVQGRRVDDDASVLMRYETGARGTLTCSQVAFGEENGLSLRVYGETGSLRWRQENPNRLEHRLPDGSLRVLTTGSGDLGEDAAASTRLPAGHPEGFIEAFANIYRGAVDRVRGEDTVHARLAPTVRDGALGVRFIERCLASGGEWVEF